MSAVCHTHPTWRVPFSSGRRAQRAFYQAVPRLARLQRCSSRSIRRRRGHRRLPQLFSPGPYPAPNGGRCPGLKAGYRLAEFRLSPASVELRPLVRWRGATLWHEHEASGPAAERLKLGPAPQLRVSAPPPHAEAADTTSALAPRCSFRGLSASPRAREGPPRPWCRLAASRPPGDRAAPSLEHPQGEPRLPGRCGGYGGLAELRFPYSPLRPPGILAPRTRPAGSSAAHLYLSTSGADAPVLHRRCSRPGSGLPSTFRQCLTLSSLGISCGLPTRRVESPHSGQYWPTVPGCSTGPGSSGRTAFARCSRLATKSTRSAALD